MTPRRRQHILLVEDNRIAAAVTRALLVDAGYEVTIALNGVQALTRLRTREPDMIASDICMPIMDGIEFLLTVRANPNWRQINFIFISGKGSVADLREALQAGANDYLIKPYSPKELLRVIAAGLQVKSRTAPRAEVDGAEPRHGASSKSTSAVGTLSKSRVLVREHGAISSLAISEIEWVESADNYLVLHAAGKRHTIRATLGAFQREFMGSGFHKISRSTVVRVDCIRRIIPSSTAQNQLVLRDGTLLLSSLSKRELTALL